MISEKAYQATAFGNFTRIAPEIPVSGVLYSTQFYACFSSACC